MQHKRSTYEIVLVSLVVLLSVALAMGLYAQRAKMRKNAVLLEELALLRNGVMLHRLVNKALPPSLSELAGGTYDVEGTPHSYLQRVPPRRDGAFIDPFGNFYRYDVRSGWIHSTTPGCERW